MTLEDVVEGAGSPVVVVSGAAVVAVVEVVVAPNVVDVVVG